MSNITQTFKSKQDQSRHFLFLKIIYNNQKGIQDIKVHEKMNPFVPNVTILNPMKTSENW